MILLLAIFLILFEATFEGLKTRGKHIASASVVHQQTLLFAIGGRFNMVT